LLISQLPSIRNRKDSNVRGKVMAGGFRIELIRISYIKINRQILEELWRGPQGTHNVAMSLSEHMLSSTYGASE
jgi:hypothetical protein